MPFHFATILLFVISAVGFAVGNMVIGWFLRPNRPSKAKSDIYECGEPAVGKAWFNFNPRFYVVALVFVIFEVEVALMLPVALVYKQFVAGGSGGLAFAEVLLFVAILAVGLVWVWSRGDLEWIKKLDENKPETRS